MSLTKTIAVANVKRNRDLFRHDFLAWLEANHGVYLEFERRALLLAHKKNHIGARAIWESMRFDSSVRDDSAFKLNGNSAPDCARLFMLMHPTYEGIFETRVRRAITLEKAA